MDVLGNPSPAGVIRHLSHHEVKESLCPRHVFPGIEKIDRFER